MNSDRREAAGIGSGVVLVWIWNDMLAPYFGLAPMPAVVAIALAPVLVAMFRISHHKVVDDGAKLPER